MKNLKKVLALGLALVMVLGMFTIASAAETKKTAQDFTDWADVEHKDAVALAVDLGVISGKPDGSFAPNDPIDRASWAKLVYFVATGDDNADAYLGTVTDLTDTKGNWAESYINYIYVNQYVSGDGQGHFMPTSNITVAGGLKTMLTVLGYDATDRGYQNNSAWMGNIMTDAKRNGLMDDIDRSQTAAVPLTRDNAAQIVYNALQANIVEGVPQWDAGNKYITTYNKGVTLGYDVFKIIPVTATVASVDADGIASFKDANPSWSSDLKDVKASSALVGETVTVWVKAKGARFNENGEMSTAGTFDSVVSTTVAKAASSAAKTFTGGVTLADIVTSGKDDYVGTGSADTIEVIMDGATKEKVSATEFNADAIAAAAKAGNVVDVFTKEGAVSTIKITTWTVKKVTGDVETRTRSDELQVRVPGVVTWTAADKVDGYQGLAEDDIVLVNVDNNSNYVIEKAEKVTGKVTSRRGSEVTIGGKKYSESGIAVSGDNAPGFSAWDVSNEKDNEYDFYMDKNGTVCYIVLIEGETTTETAYVTETAWVVGNGGIGASKYMEAKLLFADGTTEVVRVDKVFDTTDEEYKKVVADTTTSPKDDEIKYTDMAGNFVDYSVNKDGNYEIKAKGDKLAEGDKNIEAKPLFDGTAKANEKTLFLVKKGDDYSVYTSYKNVPKMAATKYAYVTEDGVVTYAYLETDKFEGEGSDGLIYIKDTDAFDLNTDGNYVYEIVDADGSETTLAIDTDAKLAVGFYTVESVDADGVATVKTSTATKESTLTIGNGILVAGSTTYAYDKTTVCVVIDLAKNKDDATKFDFSSSADFDPNNFTVETGAEASFTYEVIVLGDVNDVADYVYVIRSEK